MEKYLWPWGALAAAVAAAAAGAYFYVSRSSSSTPADLCLKDLPEPYKSQAASKIAEGAAGYDHMNSFASQCDVMGWHCAARELRAAATASGGKPSGTPPPPPAPLSKPSWWPDRWAWPAANRAPEDWPGDRPWPPTTEDYFNAGVEENDAAVRAAAIAACEASLSALPNDPIPVPASISPSGFLPSQQQMARDAIKESDPEKLKTIAYAVEDAFPAVARCLRDIAYALSIAVAPPSRRPPAR